jgi:hypothetical protein
VKPTSKGRFYVLQKELARKMMLPKMGRLLIITTVALTLATGITSCTALTPETKIPTSPPETEIPSDVPSISERESCAMVYNHLRAQIDDLKSGPLRIHMLDVLNEASSHFHANYIGKGQWIVKALGYGYNTYEEEWWFYFADGTWNAYEASGIVEPSDILSRNLLEYLQRYKVPSTTSPTPAPSSVPPEDDLVSNEGHVTKSILIYTTIHHPDGWRGMPWYEIRGDEIYTTVHHPDGWQGMPWFEIGY